MPSSFHGVALSPQYDVAWAVESSALSAGKNAAVRGNRGRIENAASEFESTLLTKWLEQARHAFAGAPGGEEEEDGDETGQVEMLDLGMQALATAVTKSGGLGIARVLCRELQGQDTRFTPSLEHPTFATGQSSALAEKKSRKD